MAMDSRYSKLPSALLPLASPSSPSSASPAVRNRVPGHHTIFDCMVITCESDMHEYLMQVALVTSLALYQLHRYKSSARCWLRFVPTAPC
jgi:hypothetical protein